MPQIESLLSARLFLAPQAVGDRVYFLSNMSGRLSLYVMDAAGSVPEPLLPPHLALQNPELIGGYAFYVFARAGKLLLSLDADGDERYQIMTIPLDGGIPEPALPGRFGLSRVRLLHCDEERNLAYLNVESLETQRFEAHRLWIETGDLEELAASDWGSAVAGVSADHSRVALVDGYTMGDTVLSLWREGVGTELLYGTPLQERRPDQQVPLTSFGACAFTAENRGLICSTSLFEDTYGLAYLPLDGTREFTPIPVHGLLHKGSGELVSLESIDERRCAIGYTIDGVSWLYEATFDDELRAFQVSRAICGTGALSDGVLESARYDRPDARWALSFSTAVEPTQLYLVGSGEDVTVRRLTRERVLGIPREQLAQGEDGSFVSFDGTRVSARLYLPSQGLGFAGPRPLVYYVHGGPQSQERPDFAWFSMPLIQFLTLNGFAVFVPNARGSTGYGLSYTKQVDHDWGGQDRLDHVHAMGLLARDERLDTRRAAVVGRSYGGYMTLTLAARHPELWSAAVDMFGPYDLLHFMETLPETWRAYFRLALGDPEHDREFLIERSPRTYLDQIRCPLLVIQGQNDPRVVESESRQVVEGLRAAGKQVEYLVFPDEGHDVLKFANRVRCYNAIADFFKEHLRP